MHTLMVREGHGGVFVRSVRCLFAFTLGSHSTRGQQIKVASYAASGSVSSLRPNGRKLRRNGVWYVGNIVASWPDETGTHVNAVVGVYLFMYSGEHRCWCLFVLVRACHLLWCGA